MSSIVNDRDLVLQSAPARTTLGTTVQWSDIGGVGKPADYADVTQAAFELGVSVTQITGGLQLHDAGAIRGGQLDYNLGTGFFLGYSGTSYKFSVGSPIGNGLNWDGTNLTLRGNLDFSYVRNGPPADANNTALALGATVPISSGGITMLGGGSVKGGQSDYNVGNGFFLGWSVNNYKLSIGNSSGNRMTWDGITLNIVGNLVGGNLRIGSGGSLGGFALEWSSSSSYFYAQQAFSTHFFSKTLINSPQPAVYAETQGLSPALYGVVLGANANENAHGIVGQHSNGSAGLIAGANGFDFYASGSGTNYGPFTGTHDALVKKVDADLFDPGHIVIDKKLIARNGWSSTIFEVSVSSIPNQPGAIGVLCANPQKLGKNVPPAAFIVGYVGGEHPKTGPRRAMASVLYQEEIEPHYKHLAVNASGEGQLWVCGEGGDIDTGDLIVTSSMPGKGMKQASDQVMKYTVAKSREGVHFSGPTDVKRCACIYLCG